MRCMDCGTENPTDMKFCGECGALLADRPARPRLRRPRQRQAGCWVSGRPGGSVWPNEPQQREDPPDHVRDSARGVESLLPAEVTVRVLGSGSCGPTRLRAALQKEIDEVTESCGDGGADPLTVLIGYGLCGNGVVGLSSGRCRLVIPRVDDCIGICLAPRAPTARKQDSILGPTT